MNKPTRLPILTTLGVLSMAAQAFEPDEPHPVVPSVVLESAGVEPGGTIWVGIVLDTEPGWHTYWPGQNDTGFGTSVAATVSDGWKVGEVHWPAPHRYIAPGEILDHVYEGDVMLLVPVTAPSDAAPGSRGEIAFDVEWLVCNEVCIPGWETVGISVPVGIASPEPDPTVAGLFAKSRARLPIDSNSVETGPRLEWNGLQVRVQIPGATTMQFYPDESGSRVEDLLHSGERSGDTLMLTLEQGDDAVLSGVVQATLPGTQPGDTDRCMVYRIHETPGRTARGSN